MVCVNVALYVCSTHGVRYIRMVKLVFRVVILYLVKYSHLYELRGTLQHCGSHGPSWCITRPRHRSYFVMKKICPSLCNE